MAEFLITKREKCEGCSGMGTHQDCNGNGYIDTQVDLLDVLKKVRWGRREHYGKGVFSEQMFSDVRIEDD